MVIRAPKPQPIEQLLADSLAYWMIQKGFTAQAQLAAKAGVDQKTVSNCLNPAQRLASVKGKDNTPKLGTVARMAAALDVPIWVLLKPPAANDPGPPVKSHHLQVIRHRPHAKQSHLDQR